MSLRFVLFYSIAIHFSFLYFLGQHECCPYNVSVLLFHCNSFLFSGQHECCPYNVSASILLYGQRLCCPFNLFCCFISLSFCTDSIYAVHSISSAVSFLYPSVRTAFMLSVQSLLLFHSSILLYGHNLLCPNYSPAIFSINSPHQSSQYHPEHSALSSHKKAAYL